MSDVSLLAEAVMTLLLGLWMATGVYDNWRFPELNRAVVRRVMRLELMAEHYPDDFAQVAHRRVQSETLIRAAFRLIVLWETLACLLLVTGAAALFSGWLGGVAPTTGHDIAVLGALAFTVTWAGFLTGGNYFLYYYCHFEGQFTHFMLVLWGSIVTAFLALV